MFRRAALSSMLLLLLTAASVSAATTRTVQVYDYSFNPAGQAAHVGDSVKWHNNGLVGHEPKSNIGNLWDKFVGSGATTAAVAFAHVGTFAYHCVIHPFMTGTIKVAMLAAPGTGGLNTTFTLTVATAAPASGWTEDIQMHRGTSAWSMWKSTTAKTATFKPSMVGNYFFRARYRRTSDNSATGWSPATQIMVV
jgi:plastocyanin